MTGFDQLRFNSSIESPPMLTQGIGRDKPPTHAARSGNKPGLSSRARPTTRQPRVMKPDSDTDLASSKLERLVGSRAMKSLNPDEQG
ncbi:MAG: hypothetical protein HC933_19110 [Pleurocapsa sp. SU_196_0]|nr:hypothetical protein [Pleurocapsa sp. SU_196_0]